MFSYSLHADTFAKFPVAVRFQVFPANVCPPQRFYYPRVRGETCRNKMTSKQLGCGMLIFFCGERAHSAWLPSKPFQGRRPRSQCIIQRDHSALLSTTYVRTYYKLTIWKDLLRYVTVGFVLSSGLCRERKEIMPGTSRVNKLFNNPLVSNPTSFTIGHQSFTSFFGNNLSTNAKCHRKSRERGEKLTWALSGRISVENSLENRARSNVTAQSTD